MNSPSPIAVLDGFLLPSQAVQPQAVTAQDTSVESMQDTEGKAGSEEMGMEKCQQATQRHMYPGMDGACHRSVSPGGCWDISFTRLSAAFVQTPNQGSSTWLRGWFCVLCHVSWWHWWLSPAVVLCCWSFCSLDNSCPQARLMA